MVSAAPRETGGFEINFIFRGTDIMTLSYKTAGFKAVKQLIDHESGEPHTGRYVFLKCFVEPGRGDIYLEGATGARVYLPAQGHVLVINEDGDQSVVLGDE